MKQPHDDTLNLYMCTQAMDSYVSVHAENTSSNASSQLLYLQDGALKDGGKNLEIQVLFVNECWM